jgi:hypothetical protein
VDGTVVDNTYGNLATTVFQFIRMHGTVQAYQYPRRYVLSPVATSERKRKEEQKNPITKTVKWKPDIDDGWTLVKRKMRSQQKIESNQSIVNS